MSLCLGESQRGATHCSLCSNVTSSNLAQQQGCRECEGSCTQLRPSQQKKRQYKEQGCIHLCRLATAELVRLTSEWLALARSVTLGGTQTNTCSTPNRCGWSRKMTRNGEMLQEHNTSKRGLTRAPVSIASCSVVTSAGLRSRQQTESKISSAAQC